MPILDTQLLSVRRTNSEYLVTSVESESKRCSAPFHHIDLLLAYGLLSQSHNFTALRYSMIETPEQPRRYHQDYVCSYLIFKQKTSELSVLKH
jgi:hypothetical protein